MILDLQRTGKIDRSRLGHCDRRRPGSDHTGGGIRRTGQRDRSRRAGGDAIVLRAPDPLTQPIGRLARCLRRARCRRHRGRNPDRCVRREGVGLSRRRPDCGQRRAGAAPGHRIAGGCRLQRGHDLRHSARDHTGASLRRSMAQERLGLDVVQHGEEATATAKAHCWCSMIAATRARPAGGSE